ncbi:aldehyde dehydrogenase family protein [Microbacterium karelineae]|uniref:aldehyde dehydrogenase family protein n=1 Tax=Microbacterium karelineae TaxID=2654283 RepID=UPI0012EA6EE1|nr:aldehyde dehydrogenase family protein [Microbacterium karelineae]
MSETTALLDRIQADPETGRAIPDAATGETIGYVPKQTADDVDAAVARAQAAQPAWDALGHEGRRAALLAAADAIDAHAEELATILSREQGKPLNGPNARFEVGACSTWLRDAATTELETEVLVDDGETYAEMSYQALGVVAAIGPWNWPMMIGMWQSAPSLRMGNTVVAKPSSSTPLSVLALIDVMNQALPADVLIPVVTNGAGGGHLAAHPDVAKVMFTGSTETGRRIAESAGGNLARLTLELGGNDAGIVLPDVDPQAIAEDLFWGAFINTGQTCAALKRLYVHEDVYDDVVDAVAAVARQVPMGNGLDEGNVLGPVQNAAQFEIVQELVEDAKARGARIVVGGEAAPELGANFFQTTIVAEVADGYRIVDEEQFGPALPIIRYSDIDEAVASANRLDVGLGGSVWSGDREKAREIAKRLRAGTVWINQHGTLHPKVPFGGVKQSGYGLEFSVAGLKSVSEPRVING